MWRGRFSQKRQQENAGDWGLSNWVHHLETTGREPHQNKGEPRKTDIGIIAEMHAPFNFPSLQVPPLQSEKRSPKIGTPKEGGLRTRCLSQAVSNC